MISIAKLKKRQALIKTVAQSPKYLEKDDLDFHVTACFCFYNKHTKILALKCLQTKLNSEILWKFFF